MKEDKVFVLRKTLVILTVILLFITAGISLVMFQTKTVTLNYFGNIKNVKTMSTSVEGFLMQNKIFISDDMIVSPDNQSKIENNLEIKIYSKKVLSKLNIDSIKTNYKPVVAKVVEIVDPIPFTEEKIDNPTINRGVTKITQEGANGEKIIKYLVKYSGETEIFRAQLKETVKTEAQKQVIEVGTKLTPYISRSAPVITPVDSGFKTYNIKLPADQQQYAYNMCKQYGVSYELLLAVMYKESGYNPEAVGGGNSYGLAQIHVSNHYNLINKLGINNLLDPYDNIKAGAYMLSIYFDSARKVVSDPATIEVYALNSYNMGEGVYFTTCFSQGIVDRSYSTSIRNLRDTLINNGGL